MAGVVFIICIPTEDKERALSTRKVQKKLPSQYNYIKNPATSNNGSSNKYKNAKANIEQQCLLQKNNETYYEAVDSTNKNGVTIEDEEPMKKIMEDILKELKIENSVWSNSTDGHYIQIMFTIESGSNYEEVLEILRENNIGLKYNSVVSVTPCALYYKGSTRDATETVDDEEDEENDHQSKESLWTKFVLSVRARLTVAQVVENIRNHARLTFDFICLVVISTTLCAIGLVENSNVYLLSSMLISPMMGPVMAATFGTVIRDKALQKMGVQNEMLGLGLAMMVGFCYGAIICLCTDKYGESDWPTNEMISRGEVRTIGVGCLIALLSGAAVALGVLSDNIASLVGVAISTSLMPPAVNAGLLWSLASVYYLKGNETTRYSTLAYTDYYSDNRLIELTSLGGMSLCLTFVNIICIYVAGLLVFKIKEVAPITCKDQVKRQFWNHDIKIARDYNKTMNNDVNPNQIPEEFLNYRPGACPNRCHLNLMNEHLHRSIDLAHSGPNERAKNCRSQYTWSPCSDMSVKPTIKELQEIYFNKLIDNSAVSRTLNFAPPLITQVRRFSQGYAALKSDVSIRIPSTSCLSKENERNLDEPFMNKARKFVVTPCVDSPKNSQT